MNITSAATDGFNARNPSSDFGAAGQRIACADRGPIVVLGKVRRFEWGPPSIEAPERGGGRNSVFGVAANTCKRHVAQTVSAATGARRTLT